MIIINTVRSNKDKQIGFLKDRRRMNVAMSRAKELLIIIGDRKTLVNYEDWNKVLLKAEILKIKE